jgi:transcriptional regulator with XRE-family HTH domain
MNRHWTYESLADFRFSVASDFVAQIQNELEVKCLSQSQLAEKIGVSEGRISQIFNNPGNLTLNTMVQCARSLELKLTVLAYDDGDKDYLRGPISSEVFRTCWEAVGKPLDNWEVKDSIRACYVARMPFGRAFSPEHIVRRDIKPQTRCAPNSSEDLIESDAQFAVRSGQATAVNTDYGLAA